MHATTAICVLIVCTTILTRAQNQTLSSLKKTICQRFGVKDPIFICEEDILDACYDDVLLRNSVITDGAVVILQKMPVSVSLTDQDTSFNFYVPQVNYIHSINVNHID